MNRKDFDRLFKYICLIFWGVIIFIISMSLIGESIHTCEKDNYCLNYNTYTKEFEKLVYKGGRHFLGYHHKFIQFPRRQRTLIMSAFHEDRVTTRADIGTEMLTFYPRDVRARSIEGMKFF